MNEITINLKNAYTTDDYSFVDFTPNPTDLNSGVDIKTLELDLINTAFGGVRADRYGTTISDFRFSRTGSLTASSANITGSLTASSANITGNLTVNDAYVGEWNGGGGNAVFCNQALKANSNDYAVLQRVAGGTLINSKSGQSLDLRINNDTKMSVLSNGNIDITNDLSVGGGLDVTGNTEINGQLSVNGNGGSILDLVGTDHAYIEFYPDGVSVGRKAYMGYSSSSTENFTIANLYPNSAVYITPHLQVAGDVFVGGNIYGNNNGDLNLYRKTTTENSESWIEIKSAKLAMGGPYIQLFAGSNGTNSYGSERLKIETNKVSLFTDTDITDDLDVGGKYKQGGNPLLHIAIPFRPGTANTTSIVDVHFFANYHTSTQSFQYNKLVAYKHPTAWYIHSVSIMHDDDTSTNGITLYLATNLNSKGQGTPSYGAFNLGSKASGDLCSTYTFSSPISVGINNSIRARTKYSSSSANETSFVLHGFQA